MDGHEPTYEKRVLLVDKVYHAFPLGRTVATSTTSPTREGRDGPGSRGRNTNRRVMVAENNPGGFTLFARLQESLGAELQASTE